MAYTKKNFFGEIILINLIRLAFAGVCICFFLPMFNTQITYLDIENLTESITLTGFNTIFGVDSSSVSGSPFALVIFIFPIIAVMITLVDFLYYHLHIVVLIGAIVGAVLSGAFFIAIMVKLNGKEEILKFTLYELKTRFSWGCIVLLGIYALIIVLSILYKKVADN